MEILAVVLEAIADAPHVQVIVMLDIELDTIPEVDAPGVSVYRNELMQFLKGKRLFGICERFYKGWCGFAKHVSLSCK